MLEIKDFNNLSEEEEVEFEKEFPFMIGYYDYDGKKERCNAFYDIPYGWAKAFGLKLLYELKEEIEKSNLTDYSIVQIKEKFGELRWYDDGGNKNTEDIIDKYTDLSRVTCISCGEKAKYISMGWISPYCEDCIGSMDRKLITEGVELA